MKTIVRIAVFIDKPGGMRNTPRSQAEFFIDSDTFFVDEQQTGHFASALIPVINSAMMDFEQESESPKPKQAPGWPKEKEAL